MQDSELEPAGAAELVAALLGLFRSYCHSCSRVSPGAGLYPKAQEEQTWVSMLHKWRSKTEPLEAGLEQNLALGAGGLGNLLPEWFQLGDVGRGWWHQAPLPQLWLWCSDPSVRVLAEMPSWVGSRRRGSETQATWLQAPSGTRFQTRPGRPGPATTWNAGCFHCVSYFSRKNRAPLSPEPQNPGL